MDDAVNDESPNLATHAVGTVGITNVETVAVAVELSVAVAEISVPFEVSVGVADALSRSTLLLTSGGSVMVGSELDTTKVGASVAVAEARSLESVREESLVAVGRLGGSTSVLISVAEATTPRVVAEGVSSPKEVVSRMAARLGKDA